MRYIIFSIFSIASLLFLPLLSSCGKSEPTGEPILEPLAEIRKPLNVVFPNTGLSASLTFKNEVSKVKKDAPFTLRFWKTVGGDSVKGPFVDPGFVLNEDTVHLEMPAHGHGSSPVTIAQVGKGSDISFAVTRVYFTMPGDWEIWVDFVKDGNVIESAKFKVAL